MRRFGLLTGLGVVAALVLAERLHIFEVRRLTQQVNQLEEDKRALREYAERLTASRRAAQVNVVDQFRDPSGHTISTLLWQEIGPDGLLGTPQELIVVGELVYFEAAVIKFKHEQIAQGDPAKSVSLVLFRRVFGDRQISAAVPQFGPSVRPPSALIGADATDGPDEARLWALFWQMMEDPAVADRYDVRVAQVEAPAAPLRAGELWEVSLDAAGGLNLRKIGGNKVSRR